MWKVVYLPEAEQESLALPPREQSALIHAVEKLEAFGPQLPFPHSSAVRQSGGLRELRPRAGRSPWRAFYARMSKVFVIAAIGPEAQNNPRGFNRAVQEATARLAAYVD